MKRLLPFLVAVALLLSSCGSSAPKETEAPKMTLDEVKAEFDSALAQTFGEVGEYSISQQQNIIIINVWSEGMTADALKAQEDDQYKDGWNEMVDKFLNAQASLQKKLDDNGHSDIVAMLNIVNDINHDRMLLVVAKHQVMYDAVNGIDKLS